ncbi:uncharacterized protein [Elaeis guineensis]|uniref:Uncharacterized protein LOC105047176 n=1 Tax=Elaeis guineensis var. tenera TaxID=51953 RepID=A0A6I9RCY6_ELAGV|nr:uncharacterized protein LOC105047176 [Elaeis guineensis]XP_029121690.1 uncharacterized protein LOC105047176 [Elaeis guineensis]
MSFLLRSGHRLLSSKPSSSIPILRRFSLPAKEDADGGEPVFDKWKLPADYDPSNFDPATARSPPSDRVWRLVDEVSTLTLADVAELSSILVRKIGLKNAPVIGVMNAGAGGTGPAGGTVGAPGKEEKKQEKTVFELRLDSFDAAAKIKVIKEVRGFTDLGLKEAKDLVEKTPTIIKRGVLKEDGEQIIEKMKAVGAKVVME